MRSTVAVLTVSAGLITSTGVAAASTVQVENGAAVFRSGPRASALVTHEVGLPAFSFEDALQATYAGPGCAAGPPVSCVAARQEIHLSNKADSFRGRSTTPLTVSAGGGADSIRAAGGDNIVDGGDGGDDVWANGESHTDVYGGAGADRILIFESMPRAQGDGGDDLLVLSAGTFDGRIAGGDGRDELVSTGLGRATLFGDASNDVLVLDSILRGSIADGGAGSDILQGGAGADTLTGAGGSDAIVSAGDGEIDTVDCGSGFDIAYADADDVVTHCEIVQTGEIPVLPQVTAARADAQELVGEMPSAT